MSRPVRKKRKGEEIEVKRYLVRSFVLKTAFTVVRLTEIVIRIIRFFQQ